MSEQNRNNRRGYNRNEREATRIQTRKISTHGNDLRVKTNQQACQEDDEVVFSRRSRTARGGESPNVALRVTGRVGDYKQKLRIADKRAFPPTTQAAKGETARRVLPMNRHHHLTLRQKQQDAAERLLTDGLRGLFNWSA